MRRGVMLGVACLRMVRGSVMRVVMRLVLRGVMMRGVMGVPRVVVRAVPTLVRMDARRDQHLLHVAIAARLVEHAEHRVAAVRMGLDQLRDVIDRRIAAREHCLELRYARLGRLRATRRYGLRGSLLGS